MESKEPLPAFVFPQHPPTPSSNPMVVFLCDDLNLAWDYAIAAEKVCSSLNFPVVATCLKECGYEGEHSECLNEMVKNNNLIGAVVIFDRSKRESYLRVPFWHNTFLEACPSGRIAILMIDSPEKSREVDMKDLIALNKATYSRYEMIRIDSLQDEKIFNVVYNIVCYLV